MIKIKNLKFSYPDGTKIFEELDFTYNGGKIGLIGKNGSGKTTLFYLIMGLLKGQSGEIEIFGKIRKREEDFGEIRRKIGLLFQNPDDQLFCPSVKEEIAFGPLNLGKNKSEVLEIVKDVCNLFGLARYKDKVSFKLSGGEKRLVSLATVIAMKPEIFLLDEPTSQLDEDTAEKVFEVLRNKVDSFIMISQEINNFKKLSVEQIYCMDNGKIFPIR